MTKVNKNDVNQIFGVNAPDQDKPPYFNNYTAGWGESRTNNGKPTIKGFNFLQQRTDQNLLWIHQNGAALPYDESIEYVDGCIVLKDDKLQRLKDGVWSVYQQKDSDIITWAGSSQQSENKSFVFKVSALSELSSAISEAGRTAYVQGDGHYIYDGENWEKDLTLEVYNFQTDQPVQYYYNKTKDWSSAIFQAQLNVYLKGFSPVLVFPSGWLDINKPIKLSVALGFAIHDYLVANNIENDFYNSTTNTFKKTWYHTLVGNAVYGTVFNWVGTTDPTDKTWRDWALIHNGNRPTDRDFIKDETKSPSWQDRTRMSNIQLFGNGMCLHAFYIARQSALAFDNVGAEDFWGAGLFLDRCYDSTFNKLTVIKCGRMIGDTKDYGYKNNLDVSKQLYAPIHISKSSGDNCNYLRFRDCHTELNLNVVADIIVTGDSSPIWFEKHHYECGQWAGGYGALKLKTVFKTGSDSGIRYFADELESDFDATNPALNQGGGYVYADSVTGTTDGYKYGAILGEYTYFGLTGSKSPNAFPQVLMLANNTSSEFSAVSSNIESVDDQTGNGSTRPLTLTDTTVIGDVSIQYQNGIKATNSSITGTFKVTSAFDTARFDVNNLVVNQLNCTSASRWYGNIRITNSDNASQLLLDFNSKLSIDEYAYINSKFVG